MSTALTNPDAGAASPPQSPIAWKVYSHSQLLYWWPVWFVGLAMAAWTIIDNYHMVLVPSSATVEAGAVSVPAGARMFAPLVHVSPSPVPGAIFVTTLVGVIILSHLSLRGVWALFAAACLAVMVIFLSWMHWWDDLYFGLASMRVHLSVAAYLGIALPLLVVWLLVIFVFDRRTYLVFELGQVRIRDELGDEEKAYDTGSVAFEKRPYDWFRWLVGRGAGDLIVRIGGPQPQTFELTNVIAVGSWLETLEHRLRTRDVV